MNRLTHAENRGRTRQGGKMRNPLRVRGAEQGHRGEQRDSKQDRMRETETERSKQAQSGDRQRIWDGATGRNGGRERRKEKNGGSKHVHAAKSMHAAESAHSRESTHAAENMHTQWERQRHKRGRQRERQAGRAQENLSVSNAPGGEKANHKYIVTISKLRESLVMKNKYIYSNHS